MTSFETVWRHPVILPAIDLHGINTKLSRRSNRSLLVNSWVGCRYMDSFAFSLKSLLWIWKISLRSWLLIAVFWWLFGDRNYSTVFQMSELELLSNFWLMMSIWLFSTRLALCPSNWMQCPYQAWKWWYIFLWAIIWISSQHYMQRRVPTWRFFNPDMPRN